MLAAPPRKPAMSHVLRTLSEVTDSLGSSGDFQHALDPQPAVLTQLEGAPEEARAS